MWHIHLNSCHYHPHSYVTGTHVNERKLGDLGVASVYFAMSFTCILPVPSVQRQYTHGCKECLFLRLTITAVNAAFNQVLISFKFQKGLWFHFQFIKSVSGFGISQPMFISSSISQCIKSASAEFTLWHYRFLNTKWLPFVNLGVKFICWNDE